MIIDGKYYVGDSSVSRLYQGANLVYDSSHPDILLDYLANGPDDGTGNPDVYFNTGFTPQLSTKIEIKFETATVDTGRLFGCGNANTASTMYNFNIRANGNTAEGSTNNSLKFFYRGANLAASITPEANTPYTVTLYGTYSGNSASAINMVVNGTTYTRSMTTSNNITDASSAYIFRWNGADASIISGVKVYYLKMWSDNNLIRFYIPVLHWNNGQYVPCFYDKVNDSYIYNLGTDTPAYKMSDDYLLDFLGAPPETTIPTTDYVSTKYDTGVVASNQLQTDIRSRIVWGRENYIFGSATSGQTTPGWQRYACQTMGGSTDADLMKLRLDFGANTNNITTSPSVDASTIVGVNTLSMWYNTVRGLYCFNGTNGITSSPVADTFSPETIYLLSLHTSNTSTNVTKGTRLYYALFTVANVPAKSFIPVLHNGQAAFLDLNSGTYIYNIGTDAPYYILKS